ncbi:cyclic nucleotide-binding/CBS domain-containing protein [Halospeciosus flavus]|uniref:Cyclic nucleotide-binding/CBS domain-containing protein n=1 Tax=Halospeciosus flavus TaxID=3032283 RepID=A0ABD5Z296_9EURY|nr:CBS domain-containing protein [Halospeciosus flavus]
MDRIALRDVMTRDFVGATESDAPREVGTLLCEEDADAAVVLRGEEPVGFLTAGVLLEHVLEGGGDATAADVMDDPPATLRPEARVDDALATMRQHGTDHLLVADGTGVLGLVHVRDLVHARGAETSAAADVETVAPEGETNHAADVRTNGGTDVDVFSRQSICEVCGSLSDSLSNRNGQLVCTDCQGV